MTVRLLIVDDDAVILAVLRHHFRAQGYAVDSASDGAVALAMLAKTSYHIVITDLLMPNLDGMGVREAVRSEYPLIRLIVMTGAVSLSNMLTCLRKGAFTFVTKPLTDLAPLDEAVASAARLVQCWLDQLAALQRLKRTESGPNPL